MLVASIFSFSSNVFFYMKDKFYVLVTLELLSAIAFNLNKTEIVPSGKGLR